MKTLSILLITLFCISSFNATAQNDPVITFQKTSHDYGMVREMGGKAVARFSFTNTGKSPLIISGVQVSCGCTAPSYSKEPILPGKMGEIVLSFDPKGRVGKFNKSATVTHNGTPNTSLLMINGEVYQGDSHDEHQEFTQYFQYNKKSTVLDDPQFEAFLTDLKPILEKNRRLTITVESSSSRVPTTLYKSNLELCKARAAEATKKVKKLMKKLGINEDIVYFTEPMYFIQGPEYAEDWKENEKIYEQYQYIKIIAQ
jgi:hypothetical protein